MPQGLRHGLRSTARASGQLRRFGRNGDLRPPPVGRLDMSLKNGQQMSTPAGGATVWHCSTAAAGHWRAGD